jgi:hypothetical protein
VESVNKVDDQRARFEAKLSDLRGRRLLAVDYWDLSNDTPEPARWHHGNWHHAVMGVEFIFDVGPATVTWTSTFTPYGVEVFHSPIEEHLVLGEGGPERLRPHARPGSVWHRYLGAAIRWTAFHWERLELGPSRRADGTVVGLARSVDVPTALRIDFDAGAVWLVAAIPQFPDMQRVFIPGDEIMVVFTHEKMRDIGFNDPAFLR